MAPASGSRNSALRHLYLEGKVVIWLNKIEDVIYEVENNIINELCCERQESPLFNVDFKSYHNMSI